MAAQLRADEAFLRLVLPLLADRTLMGAPADVVACACLVLADIAATAAVGCQRCALIRPTRELLYPETQ